MLLLYDFYTHQSSLLSGKSVFLRFLALSGQEGKGIVREAIGKQVYKYWSGQGDKN